MNSCLNCNNYKGTNKCSLGEEAFKFCTGDSNYELWEKLPQAEILRRKKSLHEAQSLELVDEPQNIDEDTGKVVDSPTADTPVDKKQPKIKSNTCNGCKFYSRFMGCFLNKTTECVQEGRKYYEFFDSPDNEKDPAPSVKEDKGQQALLDFIDSMLKDL